jgi:DNA polymerase sigma
MNNNNNKNEGFDMIKNNQVNNNMDDLSSYIEIPFQFYNNFNYINHYDSNNNNPNISNDNSENSNNFGNLRNYLRFKSTPILNINLKSEEDEDLLILDKLKKDNDELDIEYEKIENSLELVYNEHSNLLKELAKVNNEIKSINNEIQLYSAKIEEQDNKNISEINDLNIKKQLENDALDILLSQENFINLKNCHEQLLKDEEYLDKKFKDEIFDDNTIKSNLCKDIKDFQLYNKVQIKLKQNSINSIRSSLQEILEYNGYEYNVYVFGSYATGLCLPWSDLDLVLMCKNQNQNLKNLNSVQKLQEIVNLLNNTNWIDKPNIITDYYAFPYITFSTDEQHGFMKVNLTIQDKKNNIYKCVKLIREFLSSYKNLEPLTLIVKQLMKCSNTLFSLSDYKNYNNYNNNSSETLNSYSIIIMIVYFLQIQLMGTMGRTVEMINNPDRLGELFINFLLYYINFDYNEKNYIFVRTGLKDSLESDDYLHLSSFGSNLIIIDPLDHKNNLSLNAGEFKNIKIIMKLIYYSSKVKCDCSCHYLKSYKNGENKKNSDDKDNNNIFEDEKKYVELGTEHCILKKIFQTAYRINKIY